MSTVDPIEQAKRKRSAAKGRFTRIENQLSRKLIEEPDVSTADLICMVLDDLKEAWKNVNDKHESYMDVITDVTDDVTEENEKWIEDVQNRFYEVQQRCKNFKKKANSAAMVESARKARDLSYNNFHQLCVNTRSSLREDVSRETLERERKNLCIQFDYVAKLHNELLLILGSEMEADKTFYIKMFDEYSDINKSIDNLVCKLEELKLSDASGSQHKSVASTSQRNLQLEKIPLPSFDGDIRQYSRFRSDFVEMVMPTVNSKKQAAFVLRQCLSKSIVQSISSCEDDVDKILQRLDDKYADPGKVTDSIINDIRKFKTIESYNTRRLIEFINLIEWGYNDLKALKLETEICNANVVSLVESKLPKELALEWYRKIHADNSGIQTTNKFPHILKFLVIERRALEYGLSDFRVSTESKYGKVNEVTSGSYATKSFGQNSNCLMHNNASHVTSECRGYLRMSLNERYNLLRENFACYTCLKPNHLSIDCKDSKACGEDNCEKTHHPSLHQSEVSSIHNSISGDTTSCRLQIMSIPVKGRQYGKLNVFWDSGSTISLIRNAKARELKLKGTPVTLNITTVGGVKRKEYSSIYHVSLIDTNGCTRMITAYGIDKVMNDINDVSTEEFKGVFNEDEIKSSFYQCGPIDLLIGFDYAIWHPVKVEVRQNFVVLSNIFGMCIGGSCKTSDTFNSEVVNVCINIISLSDFFSIEAMGVECNPKCGGCKCGKCAPGGKNLTLKEEREFAIIDKNLVFVDDHFEVKYPWTREPNLLPNNYWLAVKKLEVLEKRLMKEEKVKVEYAEQIQDMLNRKVARELSVEELGNYDGPVYYITHHAVIRRESTSTPVRIVFNTSLNYKGHVLNDCWAKGPDAYIANLLKILIRFREKRVAFAGDISKMYHTIRLSLRDQHTHRFLWRDVEADESPKTYVMTAVSFGDRPAGTIATLAVKKIAQMNQNDFPDACKILEDNTYVDDIIDSLNSHEDVSRVTTEIEEVLKKASFRVKGWTISGEESDDVNIINKEEKVLGVTWNALQDHLCFKVKLKTSNVNKENTVFTKRIALSTVNGIYDPMGLVTPITASGKTLLRELTSIEPRLAWDDAIPECYQSKWNKFVDDLSYLQDLTFTRCIQPKGAVSDPILVTFSDASENIFGACCYFRWETLDGSYKSVLVMSKNRAAPIKRLSIVRLELCAAVLAVRIRRFIMNNCRIKIQKYIHIVDSEIVRSMIQKESYGFNTFVGTRLGEIQTYSKPEEWFWLRGSENIADIITKGQSLDLSSSSEWQNGPTFMSNPIEEWPVQNSMVQQELPERNRIILPVEAVAESCIIDIERYSKYVLLLNVTARILALQTDHTLKSISQPVTADDVMQAEKFWVKEAQKEIKAELLLGVKGVGSFRRLTPKINEEGIFVIGGRAERWVDISYNKKELPILPKGHRISLLYARHIHQSAHLGVDADVSKIRSTFWVMGLTSIVKVIRHTCVTCRKKYLKISEQKMGKLPLERLKPAPPFYHSMIDLFGPYRVKGEVNKRSTMKVYGVIITDLLTRAVYIDLSSDYSTDSFLMVLTRFTAIRGCPSVIFSDRGSQLIGAAEALKAVISELDWEKIEKESTQKGITWKLSPSDSPWWNSCCEALIRSVKKAINVAIGESVLKFSEFQTVLFHCSNILNERPIGINNGKEQDFTYLCPNDMLLGRSSSKAPVDTFCKQNTLIKRTIFVDSLANSFWSKWINSYFPSLLIEQKWHHVRRNVAEGDIVIIHDKDLKRGEWKLGRVVKVVAGKDNVVRRIEIQYKNKDSQNYIHVTRSVQRVIVILPIEEQVDSTMK